MSQSIDYNDRYKMAAYDGYVITDEKGYVLSSGVDGINKGDKTLVPQHEGYLIPMIIDDDSIKIRIFRPFVYLEKK